MKQQVSFFETESAKLILHYSSIILVHAVEAFFGMIWTAFLYLFIMFAVEMRRVYSKQNEGKEQDRKNYKVLYRDMSKKSRRIASAFILFLMTTLTLVFAVEEEFLRCAWKGALAACLVIPWMNSYYGDKKRFKFSF